MSVPQLSQDEDEPVQTKDDPKLNAIIKIQTFWRMYALNQAYKIKVQAATTIQVIYVFILQRRKEKSHRQSAKILYQTLKLIMWSKQRDNFE